MFGSLTQSVLSGVAVPIYQSILGTDVNLLGWINHKLEFQKTQRQLLKALCEYEERYRKRHGLLKLFGMSEPIDMESVFTPVEFLDDNGIRSFQSIQALEKSYRQTKKRALNSHASSRKEAIDVANQEQYLMVLGGPWSRKVYTLAQNRFRGPKA